MTQPHVGLVCRAILYQAYIKIYQIHFGFSFSHPPRLMPSSVDSQTTQPCLGLAARPNFIYYMEPFFMEYVSDTFRSSFSSPY